MSCLLIKAGDWAQQSSRSLLDLVFYVIQHQKKILSSLPSSFFLAFWLFCTLTPSSVPAVIVTFLLKHLSVDIKEQPPPSSSPRTVCSTTCSCCSGPLVFFPLCGLLGSVFFSNGVLL